MFRLLIVPYLIIEVFTTYYFVSANGFAAYAVEIVISAILGGYVVANRSWMGFFNLMKISPKEILSGVGFVVGGVYPVGERSAEHGELGEVGFSLHLAFSAIFWAFA